MRTIEQVKTITIPNTVTASLKNRTITIKGPRGTLTKSFQHAHAAMKLEKTADGVQFSAKLYFPTTKQSAVLRTLTSHVSNMITGVTKGFRYKMRLVYAHFPINANTTQNDSIIELRNFLGEKIVRTVHMLNGVKVIRSPNKDELYCEGNDVENVSQSAAMIHEACLVKGGKDIRKFLDGIYVSERGTLTE